jgi:hypothetical protein
MNDVLHFKQVATNLSAALPEGNATDSLINDL